MKTLKQRIIESIGMFFYSTNFDTYSVTNIDVEESLYKHEGTCVRITTRRPGLLIGHHGTYIKQLEEHLEKEFGPLNLKIIENNLWQGIPVGDEIV